MKEIAYPVWRISARWNDRDCKNNGVSFKTSFKKGFFETDKWWDEYKKKKLKDKKPIELLKLEIEYLGREVWYLTWFAHESLNYFDNEKEAFASFEKWFTGKGYEFTEIDYRPETYNNEIGCPMGADEQWRWKFCGCKECQKDKITVIKH